MSVHVQYTMVVIHFSENNCGVTCTEAGIKTHIMSKNTPNVKNTNNFFSLLVLKAYRHLYAFDRVRYPGLKISNCF